MKEILTKELTATEKPRQAPENAEDRVRGAIREHGPWVLATCRRLVRDHALAEEAAQDTFVLLARKGGRVPAERLAGWLYRSCRQIALRKARGEARRVRRERDPDAVSQAHPQPEHRPEPEFAELAEVLDQALHSLPSKQRRCVLACFFQGHTQSQLAKDLGISEPAVSQLKRRALENLRGRLEKLGYACGIAGLTTLLTPENLRAETEFSVKIIEKGVLAAGISGLATVTTASFGWGTWGWLSGATGLVILGLAGLWMWNLWRGGDDSPIFRGASEDALAAESSGAPGKGALTGGAVGNPGAAGGDAEEAVDVAPEFERPEVTGYFDLSEKLAEAFLTARETGSLGPLLAFGLPISEADLARIFEETNDSTEFTLKLLNHLISRSPDEFLRWFRDLPTLGGEAFIEAFQQVANKFGELRLVEYVPDLDVLQAAAKSLGQSGNGEYNDDLGQAMAWLKDPEAGGRKILDSTEHDEQEQLRQLLRLAMFWPKTDLVKALAWAEENLEGGKQADFTSMISYRLALLEPNMALDVSHLENDPLVQTKLRQFAPAGLVSLGRTEEALQALDLLEGEDRAVAVRQLAKQWVRWEEEAAVEWINQLEDPAEFDRAIMGSYEHMSPSVQQATLEHVLQLEPDPGLDKSVAHGIYRTASYIDPERGGQLIKRYMEARDMPPVSGDLVQKQPDGEDVWEPPTIMFRAIWNNIRHYNNSGRAAEGIQWLDSLEFASEEEFLNIARSPAEAWAAEDPVGARKWVRENPELTDRGREDLLQVIDEKAAAGSGGKTQ